MRRELLVNLDTFETEPRRVRSLLERLPIDCLLDAQSLATRHLQREGVYVPLELALGLGSIAFGFQRFLVGRSPRSCRFGRPRFDGRTRLGRRLGRTLRLPAADGVLLCFILECETRVCGFDRLLIGDRTCVRCVLRFELRLLACLRFLYRAEDH